MPRWSRICLITILLAAPMAGVPAADSSSDASQHTAAGKSDLLEIRGEVIQVPLEGGFWGIVGEDGKRYDPGRLPAAFQKSGLKVRIEARTVVGRISFHQWGTPIEIKHIEALPAP